MKYFIQFYFLCGAAIWQVQMQVLTEWSPYSDCSATCNKDNPARTRVRNCFPPSLCKTIEIVNTLSCNTVYTCPEYKLAEWGYWSACSASCRLSINDPIRYRTRSYCLRNESSSYECNNQVMISYEHCDVVSCPQVRSCSNLNISFIMIMDSSSGIRHSPIDNQWDQEKDFVKDFVASTDLGFNKNIEVAVVNFGSSAEIVSSCGNLTTKEKFNEFIEGLTKINGGVAINMALEKAREAYKSCTRLNTIPVIIFLTNGKENIEKNISLRVQTEEQIKSEALLFIGAVGRNVNFTEIQRMSRYEISGEVFYSNQYVNSFWELLGKSAADFTILKSVCESKGKWSEWNSWNNCNSSCGITGTQMRERYCFNPTNNFNTEDCTTEGNLAKVELRTCTLECSTFDEWSVWSVCSASCWTESHPSVTFRSRNCNNKTGPCNGLYSETRECNTNILCTVRYLSQWSSYSECSATCNVGNQIRFRTRTCSPAYLCQNIDVLNTVPCNKEFACPEYKLAEWGSWSACSASCQASPTSPIRHRTRSYCLSNASSTYQCRNEEMINYQTCNTNICKKVTSCSMMNISFIMVLDSSSTVQSTPLDKKWKDEKDFVKSFIFDSEFGTNENVQVAVVNYGSTAEIASACGSLATKSEFNIFIDNLPKLNGNTGINNALLKAREAYLGCKRLNRVPVIILITNDKESVEFDLNVRLQTETLVKKEAVLFIAAVGSKVNNTDIYRMTRFSVAGYPDMFATVFVEYFYQLLALQYDYPFILGLRICDTTGIWSSWTAWNVCGSSYCGVTGVQSRTRTCMYSYDNSYQNYNCIADGSIGYIEHRTCSYPCSFNEWSTWGPCSASCWIDVDPPTTYRTRSCNNAFNSCIGHYSENKECNTFICSVQISQWSLFSQCSQTCNQGNPVRTRTRVCLPSNLCQNVQIFDTTPCNQEIRCPEYRLAEWTAWSGCSASCKSSQSIPVQYRTRDYCLNNATSSYQCKSETMINYKSCIMQPCPIVKSCSNLNISFVLVMDSSSGVTSKLLDNKWGQEKDFVKSFISNSEFGSNTNIQVAIVNYGSVADLASSCGSLTTKMQFYEFIDNLEKKNGVCAMNNALKKAREAYQSCKRLHVLPVVIFLTNGKESIEQDINVRLETEELVKNEALLFIGAIGSEVNLTDIMRISKYVVNESEHFSNTFVSSFRDLLEVKPEDPLILGKICETKGQWGKWSGWSECSVVCGANGIHFRERICFNPTTSHIQGDCTIDGDIANIELKVCNFQCSSWNEWADWSICSRSCWEENIPSTKVRSRTCNNVLGPCYGVPSEVLECNTNVKCKVQILTHWSSFSDCSASCNQSNPIRTRTRTCLPVELCQNIEVIDIVACNREFACPQYRLGEWGDWSECSLSCRVSSSNPVRFRTRNYCVGNTTYQCSNEDMISYQTCNTDSCIRVVSCSRFNITFVMVLDSSSDISSWNHEKNFVKDFIVYSDFAKNENVQVAVVNLGSTAEIVSSCGNLTSISEFNSFIDNLPKKNDRSTAINDGLLKARQAYLGCKRFNVQPVIIFLTSGQESVEFDLNVRLRTEELVKSEALLFIGALNSSVNHSDIERISKYIVNSKEIFSGAYANRFDDLSKNYLPDNPNILGRICYTTGVWESWLPWGDCQSNFCGSTGIQLRSRSCVYRYNTTTLKDNCDADGFIAYKELRVCTEPCTFSDWSSWTPCSASCRQDDYPPTTNRTRSCNNLRLACVGLYSETRECNTNTLCQTPFQVLTEWSAFSDCSASCNDGHPIRTRTRLCSPANLCQSVDVVDTIPCNLQIACPEYRQAEWENWSACSASCKVSFTNPVRYRRRNYCLSNALSSYQCKPEELISYQACNIDSCSIVKSCSNLNISFVLVVDSSSHVLSTLFDNQWTQEKEFLKGFIGKSELGENPNLQVAVVNYGSTAEVASTCGQITSKSQFNSVIDSLRKINGTTGINNALIKAREAYKGCQRLNVLPVVIFLTNNQENVEQDFNLKLQTEGLMKNEAIIYIGAVGIHINLYEIQRISMYVINNSVIYSYQYAKSFTELSAMRPENPFVLLKLCETRGQWAEWGQWSTCSIICGALGSQLRNRGCYNPFTSLIQEDCDTSESFIAKYELRICNISCSTFNEWSAWDQCSASCWSESKPPTTSRYKSCDNLLGPCNGLIFETKECNRDMLCEDIDECQTIFSDSLCSASSVCKNTYGGFVCACLPGYSQNGSLGINTVCNDVDECLINDRETVCSASSVCKNTIGSFVCECLTGYSQNGSLGSKTACEDVDECGMEAKNTICSASSACKNTVGSFVCECLPGYSQNGLLGINTICDDIDECKFKCNWNQSNCLNTLSSYICSCVKGYKLNDDGNSCVDVDECQLKTAVSVCSSSSACKNTFGSFVCECLPGYSLIGSLGVNSTCEDINECKLTCNSNQSICVNTIGSYLCSCVSGYQLNDEWNNCKVLKESSYTNLTIIATAASCFVAIIIISIITYKVYKKNQKTRVKENIEMV